MGAACVTYHKVDDSCTDSNAQDPRRYQFESIFADNGIPSKPQEEDGCEKHNKADVQKLSASFLQGRHKSAMQ